MDQSLQLYPTMPDKHIGIQGLITIYNNTRQKY